MLHLPIKDLLTLLLLWLFFQACTSRSSGEQDAAQADSVQVSALVSQVDTVCFLHTLRQDSTKVTLVVNGLSVSGFLDVKPYEKDRGSGPFSGRLVQGRIVADWSRSGEGVTQAYEITFERRGDTLRWADGERLEQNGKWVVKPSAPVYETVLVKTDCR